MYVFSDGRSPRTVLDWGGSMHVSVCSFGLTWRYEDCNRI